MSETLEKAKKVITLIQDGFNVIEVRENIEVKNDQEWFRISAKAYSLYLISERNAREELKSKRHVSYTKNEDIDKLLVLNDKLANYALTVPALSTMPEFRILEKLVEHMPESEHKVFAIISDITMSPKIRAMQKKGRLEYFSVFKEFSKLIDAATICYYRKNYISAYLTLVPVIEGVILRWLKYDGISKKPDFNEIKKFFKNAHIRQPCPDNALFFDVYIKACNKILIEHLYKPSEYGASYSNFNRHLAAHLINNSHFATKENCIRLFLLIDVMTEIYWYEFKCKDPRFSLKYENYQSDQEIYELLIFSDFHSISPERKLLGI